MSTSRVGALAAELQSTGSGSDRSAAVFFVPGRIEVLGKHTDYAGGRSLVATTVQGFCMVACPRDDALIRIFDTGRGQVVDFAFDDDAMGKVEDWTLYPRVVARRFAQDWGRDLVGADIAFESDLPASSGLSSSSALVVGTFLALARCNHLDGDPRWQQTLLTREGLASYLGAVENGRSFGSFQGADGVGTRGGDQDHTAILCSSPGEIRQYRFLPTVCERTLDAPAGLVFALAISGVRAKKTGAAMGDYNRISELAARLEQIWEAGKGRSPATLGAIVREAPKGADWLEAGFEGAAVDPEEQHDLKRRLKQFRRETMEITPNAGDALAAGDLAGFGHWVGLSMELATELLGNQVEETIWLAAAARERGAVAASAFGAGFGGAVWALVSRDGVDGFLESWSSAYGDRFPEHRTAARFLWTTAAGPAAEV